MKKIFIALLLSVVTVCTWAQKNISFGANNSSTWKTTSNPKTLLINIDVADDMQKIAFAWTNDACSMGDVQQADVTVTGQISFSDFVNVIGKVDDQNNFVHTKSLDMSKAQFVGTYDVAELELAKKNFKAKWDASYAHKNGNDIVGFLAFPGESVVYESPYVSLSTSFAPNDVCEIHPAADGSAPSLAEILLEAGITSETHFDLVKIKLDNVNNKVTEALGNINTYALDLTEVTNLNSWADIKNQYVTNVILPVSVGALYNNVKDNFNSEKLYNVIVSKKCEDCGDVHIDAYINKPGYFANGLQYVPLLYDKDMEWNAAWYNNDNYHKGKGYGYNAKKISMIRVSGYVFARDLKSTEDYDLTEDGHLRPAAAPITYQDGYAYYPGGCSATLAPSLSDPNVNYFDPVNEDHSNSYCDGALRGAHVTHYDFTHAEFGEYVDGVFKYYPADMTISKLQRLGNEPSVQSVILPKSPTQYIIPEGFMHDSKHIHELCIPCNYTEIHRFAFLSAKNDENTGDGGGINHYTTTAAEDGEQLGILKGEVIDNGAKTMTLASTMKFVGRGAFSGYGGAAHIEDVYVLAKHAPICEFYAFDQKTYVGQDSHKQEHLIRKFNYVNPGNGMAMLHFPNTFKEDGSLDIKEMLNYSDMTRKYRLYDETGKYDNVGNILVWPTQAQYNRSFNQALAGLTWWSWKENLDDSNNPEQAFAGGDILNGESGWVAGSGDKNANHEAMFAMAAKNDGFSEKFIEEYGNNNPHNFFDGSEGKGGFDAEESPEMKEWDAQMLAKCDPADDADRPLTYNFTLYGGWHQFTIAELYDFMLEKPGPDPDRRDYFNFSRYNKNIWYAVCFPFNLTKSQLQKALGDPENNKDPYVSTLAGVNRDPKTYNITVHMSKNLLKNKIVYDKNCPNTVKCDKSTGYAATYEPVEYGDDDIVIEANKPYFILPSLPDEEISKAEKQGSAYFRKAEITSLLMKENAGKDDVVFPIPTHVHAVNGSFSAYVDGNDNEVADTTYAYNYYFVGNYIPQTMPEYAYYLDEYKKKNGSWWSSFYYSTPETKSKGKMWEANDAIVVALIEDNTSGHSKSKGFLTTEEESYGKSTYNYIWKTQPHNDEIFFYGTGNDVYARSAFGMQLENGGVATSIQFADDFEAPESAKVYNLNGQFVGTTYDNNMAKGIYIVGGKKIVVK